MARQRRRTYNPDDAPETSSSAGSATAPAPNAYTTNKDAYSTNKDAYGQTDVLNDPKWLRASIAARMSNDPSRMHTDPTLQNWAARLKQLESGGAGLNQRRAQLASGNGTRTPVANVQGVPLTADAIAGRPSADAATSTPQGQTLIGGPGRGYDPGQDARAAAVNSGRVSGGGTSVSAGGGAGPFRDPYGNRLQNVEAGTMGDPNKPGAHRVVITGPNSFETRQTIPWQDSEGVYGTKGATYNTESVIGHRTPGDVHDYLHTNNDFYPNADYHAARLAAGAAAAGVKSGEPDLGKVVGEAGVGDQKPEGRYLDKGGVMTPIENLTPQERVARGQGGFFDNLLHSPAAVKAGVPQTPEETQRFMPPDTGEPVPGTTPLLPPSQPQYGPNIPKPTGIDALVAPPPFNFAAGAGGSTPAGVSNRQAADIETPTNQNAIAKTETSPELDINKTDQTTAAFLGGGAPQRTPYVPPPPPPPPDQYA